MLSVREIIPEDVPFLMDYWYNATEKHLAGMGADPSKMPGREDFTKGLLAQIALPIEERGAYVIIWLQDGKPVGHSNTKPTFYGEQANMHLHLWQPALRKKGSGIQFVKMTVPLFFKKLKLKKLICEPYALNPAPNKTMEKIGFDFVKKYTTTPGSINFEQEVNRWEMSKEKFEALAFH